MFKLGYASLSILIISFSLQVEATTCLTEEGDAYVCDEILVRFSSNSTVEQTDETLDDNYLYQLDANNTGKIKHVEVYSDDINETIDNLKRTPGVLSADPNYVVQVDRTPNDTYYDYLWGLNNTGTNTGYSGGVVGNDIGMEEVWDLTLGSSSVVVAVIDTGVDHDHEDLAANMWVNTDEIADNGIDDDGNGYIDDIYGYDFVNSDGDPDDDHGHGTHVSGTIAAVGNNSTGVTGVSWNSKIMALKFLNANGSGSYANAILAIDYAKNNGAKIMNNSWGGGGNSSSLNAAISDADTGGILFIAAAGNDGTNNDASPHYPSSYTQDNVISVASIDRYEDKSYFSNYGLTSVDLGAPGSSILSTYPGDQYASLSGTSMATPHVSGAAAILWTIYPDKTHREIRALLFNGARSLDSMSQTSGLYKGQTVTGGTLDTMGAILEGDPSLNNSTPVASAGGSQGLVLGNSLTISGSGTDADGHVLTYEWTVSLPSGGSPSVVSTSTGFDYTPTTVGTYTFTLVVSDPYASSTADSMQVVVVNEGTTAPPTVSIVPKNGSGQELDDTDGSSQAYTSQAVYLDASGSSANLSLEDLQSLTANSGNINSGEAEFDLTYQWTFVTRPEGSTATIEDSDQEEAYFTPDMDGDYLVRVEISNGISSAEGEVPVSAEVAPASASAGGCAINTAATQHSQAYLFLLLLVLPVIRSRVKSE